MKQHILIGPISQVLDMSGLPERGAIADEELTIIENAGILISGDKIVEIAAYDSLRSQANAADTECITPQTPCVALPGLIDAHTHICFGGSRAQDYAMRNAGKSYLEIAKAGGGIWDTVTQTRKASKESLIAGIEYRAQRHLLQGVTTIEVKSGYGLSVEQELKMLRAIKEANTTADLLPTCLAAHMLPKDFEGSAEAYLAQMSEELFPQLREEGLAHRVDAFVEASAFTAEEIKPYFQKAKDMGFDLTLHADQFTTCGASKLAVELGALSADHLEASGEEEIALLAQSHTVSMALPGASMGLGCAFTPARKLLDAGGSVAIATDWNPGSGPMGNLLVQASVLGTFQKLSNAEVLAGITQRAAKALNLEDRGVLTAGALADIVLFPTHDYREITYQQGQLQPSMIWKSGASITPN